MLQAHSPLWNYLSVGPNLFLLAVALLLFKRGLSRQFPAFFAFAILDALGELMVYGADVAPFVTAEGFWRTVWVYLVVSSLLKFLVIAAVFSQLLAPYSAISRLGRTFIRGIGAAMVLFAGVLAGFAHGDSNYHLISGAHLLEQTVFVIESGVILFIFLFAAYFHLAWDRLPFGILLGFGISSCIHLATWGVIANASPSDQTRTLFAFLNMGTFQLCVLIWLYYVLVPQKMVAKSAVPLPDNTLAVWNRELERLLQQ